MLPDGSLLLLGGNKYRSHAGQSRVATLEDGGYVRPRFTSLLTTPDAGTPSWATHASMSDPRWYHSSAVLLRDGRVACAGGADYSTGEIFSPPYLDGDPQRGQIADAPSEIQYDAQFSLLVALPDGRSVAGVSLLGLGSVTHSFDQHQRYLPLSFSGNSVTGPPDANHAPPGYYVLWVVDSAGVPVSQASYVKLS